MVKRGGCVGWGVGMGQNRHMIYPRQQQVFKNLSDNALFIHKYVFIYFIGSYLETQSVGLSSQFGFPGRDQRVWLK